MMKKAQVNRLRRQTVEMLTKARIAFTGHEADNIEIADFGLNDIKNMGLELIVYENNDRYCAKELVLFPRQTCPEHRHPPMDERNIGKQETFRCRWGVVYLYREGAPAASPKAKLPKKYLDKFTVWHEVILRPGDQYTLPPNTLHWFQAGEKGAIVSEFSSKSMDESDIFTDANVNRLPVYD
jgi:D-lyxose ketol-isomerase